MQATDQMGSLMSPQGEWSPWSPCSVTCGEGWTVRRKICYGRHLDRCTGPMHDIQRCRKHRRCLRKANESRIQNTNVPNPARNLGTFCNNSSAIFRLKQKLLAEKQKKKKKEKKRKTLKYPFFCLSTIQLQAERKRRRRPSRLWENKSAGQRGVNAVLLVDEAGRCELATATSPISRSAAPADSTSNRATTPKNAPNRLFMVIDSKCSLSYAEISR